MRRVEIEYKIRQANLAEQRRRNEWRAVSLRDGPEYRRWSFVQSMVRQAQRHLVRFHCALTRPQTIQACSPFGA